MVKLQNISIGRRAVKSGIIAISPFYGIREYYDGRGKLIATYTAAIHTLDFKECGTSVVVNDEEDAIELVIVSLQ